MMRSHFADSLVLGVGGWSSSFGLPDPDDEHVLIAAQLSNADVIVTENLKDFPETLLPEGIEVKKPEEFAADVVSVDPIRAVRSLKCMLKRYHSPEMAWSEAMKILRATYSMNVACDYMELVYPSS